MTDLKSNISHMGVTVESKELWLVEDILLQGFSSLARSLQWFWPSKKAGSGTYVLPIKESNLVVHVAHAFIKNGFNVYAEVPYESESRKSIDLLAFDYHRDILVKMEAKANFENAKALVTDVEKLKLPFKSDEHHWTANTTFDFGNTFSVFSLTTNDIRIRNWWVHEDGIMGSPYGRTQEGWEKLGNSLNDAVESWDYPLRIRQPVEGDEDGMLSAYPEWAAWVVLYAIFNS